MVSEEPGGAARTSEERETFTQTNKLTSGFNDINWKHLNKKLWRRQISFLPGQVPLLRVYEQIFHSQKLIVSYYKILVWNFSSFAVLGSRALTVNEFWIWKGQPKSGFHLKVPIPDVRERSAAPFFFTWHFTSGWSMTSHRATQLSRGPRRLSCQPLLWGL